MENTNENTSPLGTPVENGSVEKTSWWRNTWELVRFAVIALIIVTPIRVFIAQPFVVSGASMYPTFVNGDYLIVDEVTYRFSEPKRNDVVIFRYPKAPKKFFIKRIIGLPNETVDINGKNVMITNAEYPEGFLLSEPFVENHIDQISHYELGENEYFVMGDNRAQSSDSRYWGPVNRDLLIGRAWLRLLPVNQISYMPGLYKETN